MAERPFRSTLHRGILHLALDTPGSSVNIFDAAAAGQIVEEMATLRDRGVRAVVVESAKPDSFLNGARLLALYSIRTPADAVRLSVETRRAYEAVQQAPVPTVAAVRGNCYGCGLEFLLHFDHRVAADTFDTHFYLTEVRDYLLLPAYGALTRLPGLVGLEGAVDLLLEGRRWPAREALHRGLVDRVFEDRGFEDSVEAFVEEVAAGRAPSPQRIGRQDPIRRRTWLRGVRRGLEQLPPSYRSVYREGLEVMARAASGRCSPEELARLEKRAFARTAAAPRVRRAVSYFFLAQMADGVGRGLAEAPVAWHLACRHPGVHDSLRVPSDKGPGTTATSGLADPWVGKARAIVAPHVERMRREVEGVPGPELEGLYQDLSRRTLRGVHIGGEPPAGAAAFVLEDASAPALEAPRRNGKARAATPIAVALRLEPRPASAPALLYLPLYRTGGRFFELALAGPPSDAHRAFYRYLVRAGFVGVLSQPGGRPAINRFLAAWLGPLVSFVRDGGSPASAQETLRRLGCLRLPADLLSSLDGRRLPALLGGAEAGDALRRLRRPGRGGPADPRLLDLLRLSLLAAVLDSLDTGCLAHPSCADLLAREVLDFPLAHGSLCSHLTPRRVAAARRGAGRLRRLLPEADLARVDAWLARGRGFYR